MSLPCNDALSAVPGDLIRFRFEGGESAGRVKQCLWVETAKKGKVWSYVLENNQMVPNERVIHVFKPTPAEGLTNEEKAVTKQLIESEEFGNLIAKQKLRQLILRTGISPSLQTSIGCILDGDAANLEVAVFLLTKRIKELQELEQASKSFVSNETDELTVKLNTALQGG